MKLKAKILGLWFVLYVKTKTKVFSQDAETSRHDTDYTVGKKHHFLDPRTRVAQIQGERLCLFVGYLWAQAY